MRRGGQASSTAMAGPPDPRRVTVLPLALVPSRPQGSPDPTTDLPAVPRSRVAETLPVRGRFPVAMVLPHRAVPRNTRLTASLAYPPDTGPGPCLATSSARPEGTRLIRVRVPADLGSGKEVVLAPVRRNLGTTRHLAATQEISVQPAREPAPGLPRPATWRPASPVPGPGPALASVPRQDRRASTSPVAPCPRGIRYRADRWHGDQRQTAIPAGVITQARPAAQDRMATQGRTAMPLPWGRRPRTAMRVRTVMRVLMATQVLTASRARTVTRVPRASRTRTVALGRGVSRDRRTVSRDRWETVSLVRPATRARRVPRGLLAGQRPPAGRGRPGRRLAASPGPVRLPD
jgi:hypothetical protein